MTLPASGSISIAQVAAEIGVALPLSLTDPAVRTLVGKSSGQIVLPTDFYGKTWFTVDFTIGAQANTPAGGTARNVRRSLTAVIAGGSGTFTYAWSLGPTWSATSLGNPSAANTYLGQTFDPAEGEVVIAENGNVTLTVTDTVRGLTRVVTHPSSIS